ncbi:MULTISPECIES: MerR family transcriptional regulator [Actinosynnema]|uniref:MerR family transcriptional regulator n=1 Tax=Actinosynnema TaxID=40566 RepID=UPI0020A485DA|nr:MerR family transcriptional regulator [Actinosynnema pretiosum]
MNSAEIARLAGVSVRTLRHYHQLGVLPEPARRANGYREYGAGDLVLLLRVRRLAELGVALEEIPGLLETDGVRVGVALDELDRELAGQIEVLAARRAAIARVRAAGTGADAPPKIAELVAAVGRELPGEVARRDREILLLLHQGLDARGREVLAAVLGRMVEPELLPGITALAVRFAALGPDSGDDEVERLARDYRELVDGFGDKPGGRVVLRTDAVLSAYQETAFTSAQRAVLERLGESGG